MGVEFRAIGTIEHGEEYETGECDPVSGAPIIGNRIIKFPHGAKVEGLSKEVMAKLWELQVLEKVETSEPTVTVEEKKVKAPAAPPSPSTSSGSTSPTAPTGKKE